MRFFWTTRKYFIRIQNYLNKNTHTKTLNKMYFGERLPSYLAADSFIGLKLFNLVLALSQDRTGYSDNCFIPASKGGSNVIISEDQIPTFHFNCCTGLIYLYWRDPWIAYYNCAKNVNDTLGELGVSWIKAVCQIEHRVMVVA